MKVIQYDLNNGTGHPAILGFSPFNEPHPVGLGKQLFEENILRELYSNVLVEINKFDHIAFILSNLDWIGQSILLLTAL